MLHDIAWFAGHVLREYRACFNGSNVLLYGSYYILWMYDLKLGNKLKTKKSI